MRAWTVGEFDEMLGYDCMYAGLRVGPVVLDGQQYGQKSCVPMTEEAKAEMLADAELIGAVPRLLEWREARRAFLALPPNAPGARAALDRLANAESALYESKG